MDLEDVDGRLRDLVAKIPAGDRAYLLTVLTADDQARAAAVGNLRD